MGYILSVQPTTTDTAVSFDIELTVACILAFEVNDFFWLLLWYIDSEKLVKSLVSLIYA